VHEHALCWVKSGHEVTVLTGVPNHPRGVLFQGYKNSRLQEEWIDGVRVVRTWMYVTPNEGRVRRTLNYALFALTAVIASLRLERPDVVVATIPQFFCGVAGSVIARIKRRPFVLEVRDLWPYSIVQLGQLRARWLIRTLEALETALYRSAAGVVVNSAPFEKHIAARGIPPERIALIYNGVDPIEFHPRPRDEALLSTHGLEGKFLVAYVGTLGLAHGLETVLDAAAKMREEREVLFLLVGDGADRARLESEVARQKLENVRFLGLRPHTEIPAWIASMDVLLATLRNLPVFETVIPSKIFEFLAEERPVVLAAKGEIRRLMSEVKAGVIIDPEDADQLTQAIAWIRAHPEEAAARARSGREWVKANFSREDLAARMVSFLASISGTES
jgi:glycosyltransferase involved in cell wall biosynthesis